MLEGREDCKQLVQQYNRVVNQNRDLQTELHHKNERIKALEAEIELLKNPPVPELYYENKKKEGAE